MELKITKGELVFVGRSINMIEGSNRTDTRLIVSIQDDFKIDEIADKGIPVKELGDTIDVIASRLQLEWLIDLIDKRFKKADIASFEARYVLTLEDKLKVLLEEVEPQPLEE